MTTAVARGLEADDRESEERPTLGLHVADTPREELRPDSFDPTRGTQIGSQPYDDPTQGRKLGSNPYDDPTQGRKLGPDPYDDPTQGRKLGSDPYDDPTRAR
jgi:predicted Zn-dependent protease